MELKNEKESNYEILDTPDKDKVTDSQLARLNTQIDIKNNLLGFINTTIIHLEDKDSVKNKILSLMKTKIENSHEDEITLAVLAQTYGILSKCDNELAIGLFDLIKSAKKHLLDPPRDDERGNGNNNNNDNGLNKEDMGEIKEMYDFMRQAKKNEFTEGEKV